MSTAPAPTSSPQTERPTRVDTPAQQRATEDNSPSVYPPTPAHVSSSDLDGVRYDVGAVGRGASAQFLRRAVEARAARGEVSENSQAERYAQTRGVAEQENERSGQEGSLRELTRRAVADARAINFSSSTNTGTPAPTGGLGRSHPFAQVVQESEFPPDLGTPIELRTPRTKPKPNGVSPPPPPAAPARRHPPISGPLSAPRGRSTSNSSSASMGGVNKDELLAGLASALEDERKKSRALALEVGRGELEIDEIREAIKSTRHSYDTTYEEQAALIAELQMDLDDVTQELEGAYDLSEKDAETYLALLERPHPSLNSSPSKATPASGVVGPFDQAALSATANSALLAQAQGTPARASKLSRAQRRTQLETQLGLVHGPATAQEPDGAVIELGRGREVSVVSRVVRALSRSRSRTRERDQLEELERRVAVQADEDGKSRPPVSGGRPALGRKRSSSLTKAVKGLGRAIFPSNAPAPAPAGDQNEGFVVYPQPEQAARQGGDIEAWVKRAHSNPSEVRRVTFGGKSIGSPLRGPGVTEDESGGPRVWL